MFACQRVRFPPSLLVDAIERASTWSLGSNDLKVAWLLKARGEAGQFRNGYQMMNVQEFKLETSVPERGVCLRARLLTGTRSQRIYYIFVDGTILRTRYTHESRAYADAAIIRRAIQKRKTK